MKSGLLWFDNSKSPIAAKIEVAAKRYKEKFGIRPNICFISPSDHSLDAKVSGMKIQTKTTIMPSHIWLGVAGR